MVRFVNSTTRLPRNPPSRWMKSILVSYAGFCSKPRYFFGSRTFQSCIDHTTTVDLIHRLVDEDPKALTLAGFGGLTPLHLACHHFRDSPEILHCLLDQCPPLAILLRHIEGCTPLHSACSSGCSIDVIRGRIFLSPKVLKMSSKDGRSVLDWTGLVNAVRRLAILLIVKQ
jgi:hypothetical protein